jgi:two-component system, cell cycle sensor histidine kinase and response regulator CckA
MPKRLLEIDSQGMAAMDALRQSEDRYRSLFENSPVALWEEDFSAVKRFVDDLHAKGIGDFDAYFAEHPEAVAECASLVKILDVNQSSLRLFEAPTKEALLGGLATVFNEESLPQFKTQLIAISRGEPFLETVVTNRTLTGRKIYAMLRWSVVPGSEASLAKVIVSLLDVTERKKAEHELSLLAHTLRSISECVSITDTSDNICFVNEAFLKTYGYAEHELIGKNISILRSDRNPPEVTKEILPATMRGGWRGEILNRRKDGSDFPIYLSTSIVRDETRQPIYLVGIARDISNENKVQDEIHRSRQMLQLILDNIPQRVFWKDSGFRYLGCNKSFAGDAGLSHPREVIGKNDFELTWHETAQMYRADDQQVMATDKPKLRFEEPERKADGNTLWLRTSKIPLHDREGKVIGVLGTYEDITEQKQAEQALRASEEKYRKFFDENLSGVYITSPHGKLLACNPTFLQIFGFVSLEEAMGMDMALLYPDPDAWEGIIKRLHGAKELAHQEMELRRKDGKPVYVVQNIFGVFDDRGNVLEIKGYIFDDTNRKKLEQQLHQSQKIEAMGRLAGGIAHDFNNLLTCINGYTELLLIQFQGSASQRKYVEEVHAAGERAAKLTRQLLAFSRRQMLQPEVLDLNNIVQEMERMLQRLIGEDIHLGIDLNPQLGQVRADPGQIEQVIMNLVVNARDAMPHGGHLSIQTENVMLGEEFVQEHEGAKPGQYVLLAVSDNGCGIGPEARTHLFEPFFTTKELGKGTGLGLSTVYGIVKQSEGYIYVDSQEGLGSVFSVYLPRVDGQANPAKRRATAAGQLRGSETILLVEDEEAVLELARSLLRRQGYRVFAAQDGASAIQICRQHEGPIHLLVTDVVMPIIGGCELARQVRAMRPEIKILFMSGYSEDAILHKGLLESSASFLHKPFSTTSLTDKVREVLDLASP